MAAWRWSRQHLGRDQRARGAHDHVEHGPNAGYDSEAYAKALIETSKKPGVVVRKEGDVDEAMKTAAKVVSADYYAPHLAHTPMEPPAALAHVTDKGCEVWTCTQNPQGARDEVAKALKLPPEQVAVHVTLVGGGFGRSRSRITASRQHSCRRRSARQCA